MGATENDRKKPRKVYLPSSTDEGRQLTLEIIDRAIEAERINGPLTPVWSPSASLITEDEIKRVLATVSTPRLEGVFESYTQQIIMESRMKTESKRGFHHVVMELAEQHTEHCERLDRLYYGGEIDFDER